MSFAQLTGRHSRLLRELSMACGTLPWHPGRIDRLARDLAATEREIAACRALQARAEGAPDTDRPQRASVLQAPIDANLSRQKERGGNAPAPAPALSSMCSRRLVPGIAQVTDGWLNTNLRST
jgi:hypothetical protein